MKGAGQRLRYKPNKGVAARSRKLPYPCAASPAAASALAPNDMTVKSSAVTIKLRLLTLGRVANRSDSRTWLGSRLPPSLTQLKTGNKLKGAQSQRTEPRSAAKANRTEPGMRASHVGSALSDSSHSQPHLPHVGRSHSARQSKPNTLTHRV